jgi:lambda repressor-like predicted transcriptional regulator
MNADEVVEVLRERVQQAGSISAFSRETGIHPATVSNVLSRCAKNPGPSILNALGLKKTVSYEPKGG